MGDWYNPFSWGKDSPTDAANSAAGQVRQAGDQAMGLAGQQFGTQMQGLSGALGQYMPAYGALGNYGSYMNGPSSLGSAYQQYGQSLGGQTQSQGAYAGAQRALMGPTSTQQFAGGLAGMMPNSSNYAFGQAAGQGPSAQQTANLGLSSQLYGPSQTQQYQAQNGTLGQGAAERFYNQAGGQMGSPGMLEQQAGGLASKAGSAANSLQTAFDTTQRGFSNLGAMTDQAVSRNQEMGNTLQANIAKSDQTYAQPGQLAGMQGDISKAYNSANDVQGFAQRQGGNFEKQGMGEQFAQNFLNQDNPYYQRQAQKLTDQMNQQFAARGLFNSGGAIAGLGNALGEFNADNYKNMADVSAQGQQMQMQRLGQGQGLAAASSGEKQALGSNLQGLGQGLSQEWLGRDSNRIAANNSMSQIAQGQQALNLQGAQQGENARLQGLQGYLGAAGNLSGANLAGAQGAAGILGQGQGAGLSRMSALGDLAQNAQSGELSRAQYGLGASQASDSSQLGRIGMAQNLAQGADAGRMGNLNAMIAAAQNGDQTALAGLNMRLNAAQGADSSLLGRQQALAGMAGNADSARLGGLQAMFGAAGNLDQYQNAQQLAYLQAQMGLSNNMAGMYAPFYSQGGQLAGDMYNTGLGAYGNAAGLQLQGALADYAGAGDMMKFGTTATLKGFGVGGYGPSGGGG